MPTITAGHVFGSTDIVNAVDLNDLVERAVITGLDANAFSDSAVGISLYTAISTLSGGSVSFQYQADQVVTGGPYAIPMFILNGGESRHAALFSPLGLETARLFRKDAGNFRPGTAWVAFDSAAGVTLQAAYTYTVGLPRHNFIGSNYGTAAGGCIRMTLRGPAPAYVVDAGDTIRKYYYLLNAATGQWQHSPGATNTDKVAALALRQTDNGDTTLPMFLFGSPVWRA